MSKLFLDLDGVLCDFERRYQELFGPMVFDKDSLSSKTEWENVKWDMFVEGDNFQKLDIMPGALGLISFAESTGRQVEILTSVGGSKHKDKVRADKLIWLEYQGLDYPVNFVISGSSKGTFAHPGDILIDDTRKCIVSFEKAGGRGVLHKDVYLTINEVSKLL